MSLNLRRLTTIAALLIGALLPSAASAATLYISEYSNIGAIGSNTTPWPPGPVVASQTVAVGGASVQSSAFGSTTKLVSLFCDIGCSISIAATPTATTVLQVLQQGVTYSFPVSPGQKVAVIANTAGNTGGSSGSSVIPIPLIGTYTDKSGSVTLGGTSQTLAAANTSRRRIIIQNPLDAAGQGIATAENLCINFTSSASATAGTSICLLP